MSITYFPHQQFKSKINIKFPLINKFHSLFPYVLNSLNSVFSEQDLDKNLLEIFQNYLDNIESLENLDIDHLINFYNLFSQPYPIIKKDSGSDLHFVVDSYSKDYQINQTPRYIIYQDKKKFKSPEDLLNFKWEHHQGPYYYYCYDNSQKRKL